MRARLLPAPSPPRRLRTLGGAFLLAALASLLLSCGGSPAERPNVLLITVESLRTDRVGCYGCERPTTPALDELARQGTRYTDAHSVTSWTLASHATLFTGLYPTAHQVTRPVDRLGDSYTTLAEHFAARGYRTAGCASGPFLRTPHNLNQGFEFYDDSPSAPSQQVAHGDVTNPAVEKIMLDYLDGAARDDRPFFLFAYLWDPHYDFIPPAPYDTLFRSAGAEPFDLTRFELNPLIYAGMPAGRLRYLEDQYEGEIRWTDELLGHLWAAMRERGLWEKTIVVVTADHGEEFFDHGEKGHKNNLHAETIHVPLVIKWAGPPAPAVDHRLAGLIDIFPTLVEATGTEFDGELHGRSLLGKARGGDDPLFFELVTTFYGIGANRGRNEIEQWWGARRGDYKMVSVPGRRWNALYDVKGDPREMRPVETAHPELLEEMLAMLGPWQRRMQAVAKKHGPREPAFLSGEEIERLKALGYMGN